MIISEFCESLFNDCNEVSTERLFKLFAESDRSFRITGSRCKKREASLLLILLRSRNLLSWLN